MKKLKGIIAGIVSMCVLSTMITNVSAIEFENVSIEDEDIISVINDDIQSNEITQALQDYVDALQELKTAEIEIANIKKELNALKHGSSEFNETMSKLNEALKNIEDIKINLVNAKIRLISLKEDYYKNNNHQIGDSENNNAVIGDSEDDNHVVIGNSDKKDNHHHHHEFKEDSWEGFVSSDFIFTNNKKFKDKKNPELKAQVLALMDAYEDSEIYIADGTESWWLKNKYQLTLKITGEEKYEIKFNPIFTDGELTSCYMYVLADDDIITEGYFITANDYTSLKQSLNDTFLEDNVVAHKNNIKDFDDFIKFIEDNYEEQDDYFYDVDGNGKVASNDLLQNKKYLLGLSEDIGNYDSTNDGNCNSADLLNLKKKLLGIL